MAAKGQVFPASSYEDAVKDVVGTAAIDDWVFHDANDHILISGIPHSFELYNNAFIPLDYPSNALLKIHDGNISTFDRIVENPNEMYRYLITHLQPPTLKIIITGLESGKRRAKEEFSVHIDASTHISKSWNSIISIIKSESSKKETIHDCIQEYCASKDKYKLFMMRKQVNWEFYKLTAALTKIARAAGFNKDVTVRYVYGKYKVSAYPPGIKSKLKHHGLTKCTCLPNLFKCCFSRKENRKL